MTDAYLRPIAFRGSEQIGVSAPAWPSIARGHRLLGLAELLQPLRKRSKGVRLMHAKWRRPDPRSASPGNAKAAGLYMICTLTKEMPPSGRATPMR